MSNNSFKDKVEKYSALQSDRVKITDKYIAFLNEKGQLHRESGPAIEYVSGDKSWNINGKYHREDGPAVEYASGDKYWYINGKLHRKDGPAIEWREGDKSWYIDGMKYSEKDFNKEIAARKIIK